MHRPGGTVTPVTGLDAQQFSPFVSYVGDDHTVLLGSSAWAWYAVDLSDMSASKIDGPTLELDGAARTWSGRDHENRVLLFGADGVYAFDGTGFEKRTPPTTSYAHLDKPFQHLLTTDALDLYITDDWHVVRVPVADRTRACKGPVCGEWESCDKGGNVCALSGTTSRSCTLEESPGCSASSTSYEAACGDGDPEGLACGSGGCGAWGNCVATTPTTAKPSLAR